DKFSQLQELVPPPVVFQTAQVLLGGLHVVLHETTLLEVRGFRHARRRPLAAPRAFPRPRRTFESAADSRIKPKAGQPTMLERLEERFGHVRRQVDSPAAVKARHAACGSAVYDRQPSGR